MTWPVLSALLDKMKKYPPIDVIAAGWLKKYEPKPIGEVVGAVGLPMKRGKVKRRGDIRR